MRCKLEKYGTDRALNSSPLCNSRNFMLQKRVIFVKCTVMKELSANVVLGRHDADVAFSGRR